MLLEKQEIEKRKSMLGKALSLLSESAKEKYLVIEG